MDILRDFLTRLSGQRLERLAERRNLRGTRSDLIDALVNACEDDIHGFLEEIPGQELRQVAGQLDGLELPAGYYEYGVHILRHFVATALTIRLQSAALEQSRQTGETYHERLERVNRGDVKDLRDLFLVGRLYYRPYVYFRYRLNPFGHVLRAMPEAEQRKLRAFSSEFADDSPGIGPFNVLLVYAQDVASSNLSLARARFPTHTRVQLRPYSVETCYGYWVPPLYFAELDGRIEAAKDERRAFVNELLDWLEDEGRRRTVDAYEQYLTQAKRTIDVAGVDWPYGDDDGVFDLQKVESLISNLLDDLRSESWLSRYLQPYLSILVPLDQSGQFEKDFLGYFAEQSKRSRYRSKLARLLLDSVVDEAYDLSPSEVRKAFEQSIDVVARKAKSVKRPMVA